MPDAAEERPYGASLRAILLAALSVGIVLLVPGQPVEPVFAVVLGAAAGVYVGFALLDGRPGVLRIEVGAAVAFIVVASVGAWRSTPLIAIGYALHAAWDAAHRPRGVPTGIVSWWPPFCLTYDLLLAAFLVVWWLLGP
jgi:hypothetical protein